MKTFKNESAFTRWFCDILTKHNAKVIAFVGSTMQRSGLPDRYICHNKFRGWVEFKKDKGKLTVGQRLFMQGLQDRGDNCGVVRYLSKERVIRFESIDGDFCGELDLETADAFSILISLQGLCVNRRTC